MDVGVHQPWHEELTAEQQARKYENQPGIKTSPAGVIYSLLIQLGHFRRAEPKRLRQFLQILAFSNESNLKAEESSRVIVE